MLPLKSLLEKINPLDKGNSSFGEFCLGLVINEKRIKSAVWNLSGSEESLIFGTSEGWGNESAEELIVAADTSIASAVAKLPHLEGKQPTKVILGLPEHWVEGNSVNPKKVTILQKVCQKLLLKSLGFVVTPEAIAHFLREEEGGLPSIILVNLGEAEIIVSLVAKGKFLGSKIVGRSDSLALDLEEGLLRFDYQSVLPNRILLIEDADLSGDIEELKQTLVAYPWVGPENEKKLNFLQLPKIEVAEPDFEVRAVVVAGKHELGLEVAKEPAVTKEARLEEAVGVKEKLTVEEVTVVPEGNIESAKDELFSEATAEDFGFVKGEDILLNQPSLEEGELLATKKQVSMETEVVPPKPLPEIKKKRPVNLKFWQSFPSRFNFLAKLKPSAGFARPSFRFAFNKTLVLLLVVMLVVSGLGFFSFYSLAKAEVKILVQPQKVEKEFEFTISSKTSSVDSEKMVVPTREMIAEVSGSKTGNVNGKKIIGDKAKGEVSIYNGNEKTKILAKGTVLKGLNGLKFLLDDQVTTASKTADLTAIPPVEKWGEVKATVVASDIGAEYNIVAGSTFSLESGGEAILIKNSPAFSGGSSREVQAVSKEDREGLQKSLLTELEKNASQEIAGKLSPSDYLLPDSLQLTSKADHFNHELGDEAGSLTLEGKATFSVLYLKDEDFRVLADKNISQLVPEGYQKEPSKEESHFALSDKVKGAYTAKIQGEFIPALGIGDIPRKLRAKTFIQGEKVINSLPQVAGVNISIWPKLFSFLKVLPLKEQNITVVLETL